MEIPREVSYQVAFIWRLTVGPELSKGEHDCWLVLRYLSTNGSDRVRDGRVLKATWSHGQTKMDIHGGSCHGLAC